MISCFSAPDLINSCQWGEVSFFQSYLLSHSRILTLTQLSMREEMKRKEINPVETNEEMTEKKSSCQASPGTSGQSHIFVCLSFVFLVKLIQGRVQHALTQTHCASLCWPSAAFSRGRINQKDICTDVLFLSYACFISYWTAGLARSVC